GASWSGAWRTGPSTTCRRPSSGSSTTAPAEPRGAGRRPGSTGAATPRQQARGRSPAEVRPDPPGSVEGAAQPLDHAGRVAVLAVEVGGVPELLDRWGAHGQVGPQHVGPRGLAGRQ